MEGGSKIFIIIVMLLFLVSAGVAIYYLVRPSSECTLNNLWDNGTPCTARQQEELTFSQCETQGGRDPCLANCDNLLGNRDPCVYFEDTPCRQVYACNTCSPNVPLSQCNDKPLLNSAMDSIYCIANDDRIDHNCDKVCETLYDRGELYLEAPEKDTVGIRYLRCDRSGEYNYCTDTEWCNCTADNVTGCTTREQLDLQLEVCERGFTDIDNIDGCSALCERYADLYGELSCENPACSNNSAYCCGLLVESGEGQCENPFVLIDLIQEQC